MTMLLNLAAKAAAEAATKTVDAATSAAAAVQTAVPAPVEEVVEESFFRTVVEFFQSGGNFMPIIGAVLVVGLAISIERWIYLSTATKRNKDIFSRILPLLQTQQYKKAFEMTNEVRCGVSSIIGAGIARMATRSHQQADNKREDIEIAMEEGLMEAIPKLQERTSYLATLANIATLLGLLGTIIGLIAAFSAVANADPADKARLLSLSISVAMNTTAFGLMAAIPILICNALLQTKTTKIVDSIEMAGVKFLNVVDSSHDELSEVTEAATNED